MHLDSYGFPCTLNDDGKLDRNDQLQRVAMIYCVNNYCGEFSTDNNEINVAFRESPGIYVRYPNGRPGDLSGDALISLLAAFVRRNRYDSAWEITKEIIKRGGFSQNIYDMYGSTVKKTPDFILFRALPLMWRSSPKLMFLRFVLFGCTMGLATVSLWFYLLLFFVTDLPLLIFALTAWIPVWKDDKGFEKRTMDDVDDNVVIMTFLACSDTMSTALSDLSPRIYRWLRPRNYGQQWLSKTPEGGGHVYIPYPDGKKYGPVMGALKWYHRAPAGNPEIADLYEEHIRRVFGEKNA